MKASALLLDYVPDRDGVVEVSASIVVAEGTDFSFRVACRFVDHDGEARVEVIPFLPKGTEQISSPGPYEGIPVLVQVKAGHRVTIGTEGSFDDVTYGGSALAADVS